MAAKLPDTLAFLVSGTIVIGLFGNKDMSEQDMGI